MQELVHLLEDIDIKLAPWSLRISSGIPVREKTVTNSFAILLASVLDRGIASG